MYSNSKGIFFFFLGLAVVVVAAVYAVLMIRQTWKIIRRDQ